MVTTTQTVLHFQLSIGAAGYHIHQNCQLPPYWALSSGTDGLMELFPPSRADLGLQGVVSLQLLHPRYCYSSNSFRELFRTLSSPGRKNGVKIQEFKD